MPVLVVAAAMAGCGPSARTDLAEACGVAEATLVAPRAPVDNALARAGQALIYQATANRYALLAMPGCRVTPLADVPERIGLGDVFLLPGGARLFTTSPPGRADRSWWHAGGPDDVPARLAFLPDPASSYSPILSDDGRWVAWPRLGTREAFRVEVVMRPPDGSAETSITIPRLEPDAYQLLQLDATAREVTIARGLAEFMRVGFDGGIRWREHVEGVAAQPETFVRVADRSFAWDAVRDSGPYRLGWSGPSGRDTIAFERLRQIQHAAVDPSGAFAAVSLETQHGRLLSLSDAVAIVRLRDHREVFRTYLPRYTRSRVAFLTDAYVAYSDADRVHVLRVQP